MKHVGWWMVVTAAACSTAAVPDEATDGGRDPSAHLDAPTADGATAVTYPDPEWPIGTPDEVGIDPSAIDAAVAAADDLHSSCLLVIRHGKLVAERYMNGATASDTPSSYSIAKSYTSTTVGIAIDKGALPSIDMKAASMIPSWNGNARDQITLRHLLTMTSGLQWSIFRDYIQMAKLAPDKSAFAVGSDPQSPVGSSWVYNNSGVQSIEPLFRAATGTPIDTYARQNLWSKIGMSATWEHDSAGHPTTFANVLATCKDHAKLGYLYLHGGRWKNEQVVSSSWITAATTPSQTINQGYGYLIWLNGHAPTVSSTGTVKNQPLYDYAPADTFGFHGFGGQFVEVIPSLDMIIVRFGPDPTGAIHSSDPLAVSAAMAEDEMSDRHRRIVAPIVAGAH